MPEMSKVIIVVLSLVCSRGGSCSMDLFKPSGSAESTGCGLRFLEPQQEKGFGRKENIRNRFFGVNRRRAGSTAEGSSGVSIA